MAFKRELYNLGFYQKLQTNKDDSLSLKLIFNFTGVVLSLKDILRCLFSSFSFPTRPRRLSAHVDLCVRVPEPDKEVIVSPVMKRQGEWGDRIFNISPRSGESAVHAP